MLIKRLILMFRHYFESLKDPTAKMLPAPTVPEDAISARLGVSSPPDKISRQYDETFKRHGRNIPVPFLRALAKRESNFRSHDIGGSYWGLLQVGWKGKNSVLAGFNARHNTSYKKSDLLRPAVNVMVASDLLSRIMKVYGEVSKESRLMANLKPNFANKEFVKLLLAGWNSGYSKAGGVLLVARYLAKKGIPVTHDAVFALAHRAGATKFLRAGVHDKSGDHARLKQKWQRGVQSLYFHMDDFSGPENSDSNHGDSGPSQLLASSKASMPSGSSTSLALVAPIALGLGLVGLLAAKG